MKVFIAQQNYHIGNFEYNTSKILAAIATAKQENADLIIFSELAICGYPPRDFLEFDDFVGQATAALDKIRLAADTIAVLVGCPSVNPDADGKRLYNSAYFLYENEVKAVIHKSLLPTYDIFDENRYFEPNNQWKLVDYKGKKLAVTICEDIWNLGDNPMYRVCPMDKLMALQPDIMLNLSASPYDYAHATDRKVILQKNVLKYGIPVIYCNSIGSQTELIFDGGSLAMDRVGNAVKVLPYFEEALDFVELDGGCNFIAPESEETNVENVPTIKQTALEPEKNIEGIYQALILGIRDYFTKMGFKKAVVAASGGIDSAVVQTLACHALGADNVLALLLPSQFSSGHSIDDAILLSDNLQNRYEIIPIKDVYGAFEYALEPMFSGMPFSVAEENLQSRIRGTLVMAVANKFGSILLNTSNKSELATGYGTLYGDMAGGLSVIGDLYKLQVYALARYINDEFDVIPRNILHKAPSAELRPNQKDSDSLPEYAVLDPILYQYIEQRNGPAEITALGYDKSLVNRILKLVNTNEYKRNQFCPIIRVSPKAFGIGRRMPIVGKYLS
jgi:NAD+ synthase (glutamine-hydrolysing)